MGGSQSKDTDQTLVSIDPERDRRQVHLYPVQERRRSGGPACRRPYRRQRQQSQRELRPVEGRHGPSALRLQRQPDGCQGAKVAGDRAGPTSRPARKAGCRSRTTRCRAPSGCRPACPTTPSTFYRRRAEEGAARRRSGNLHRAHLPDRPLPDRRRDAPTSSRRTRTRPSRSSRSEGWAVQVRRCSGVRHLAPALRRSPSTAHTEARSMRMFHGMVLSRFAMEIATALRRPALAGAIVSYGAIEIRDRLGRCLARSRDTSPSISAC